MKTTILAVDLSFVMKANFKKIWLNRNTIVVIIIIIIIIIISSSSSSSNVSLVLI